MKVSKQFRLLANLSCIGMLIVLLAGALVTNTDSGLGCGNDWPLCEGKFVPAHTVESVIEWSHRFVSGIEGILVLIVFILIYRKYRQNTADYREPMWYGFYALLFTVVQALMGAAAVKWPQSDPVMAIHFGISLVAFAATLLLVIWCYRDKRGIVETKLFPRQIFPWALATAIYCYVVVYLGAFIRHTESAGGCLGWPLCNGEVIPELSGATGIAFMHRVAAAILGFVLIAFYVYLRKVTGKESSISKTAWYVLVLVFAQIFSGAWLVYTIGDENWFLFTSLLHNLIIVALFGMQVDLVIRSWIYREKQ